MNFTNRLNNTLTSLDKLDKLIINYNDKGQLKNHLISLSEDLAKYKNMFEKNTILDKEKDEIKFKIQDVLRMINEIEISVRNKLVITKKYNSYLNS
tara:strand:- start:544 stop:831 length:288 start_codon:yes stop_codon:yes gene_type:complete